MIMLKVVVCLCVAVPVHQRQQRHLRAARSIIHGTADHSGVLPSTLGASQSTCPSETASKQVLDELTSQQGKDKEQH